MVYSKRYNITFWGLEKLHPFDACKYRRVVAALQKQFPQMRLLGAPRASRELLEDVHTQEYLHQLEASSRKVAEVTELALLACMPNFLLQARVVVPMQYHTGGTVLAAAAAVARGWAVNLGGGMHHACRDNGQGWCPYDDLYLAVRQLRRASAGAVRTAMIIDTDAHQGNGYERDKLAFGDPDVFVVDAYNSDIFPLDQPAKQAIDVEVALHTGCDDTQYLAELDKALQSAFARCKPHIILYNAGTDPLAGDPLGRMQVSADGILQRDMMVWQAALRHRVPICMVLSGGYSKDSAQVIHRSIAQLLQTFQLAS